ncbi:DUF5677 domain-containing protein [Hyphomonas sp.]|uniref:DUF5677 domain-containing protein n=1 Tax=Hyphomonas sp. TaxID=87 RepID=UPI0039193E54
MHEATADEPFHRLADLTDRSVLEMAGLIAPLWKSDAISGRRAEVLATLSTTCLSTTGSALLLIEAGRVWDASILQRSVLEGTVRFIYLLHGDGGFDERLDEFSFTLEDIAWFRLTQKVRSFLQVLGDKKLDDGSQQTLETMQLPDAEYERISQKYPKRDRRQLEDKWSFGKLLDYLASKDILPTQAAADLQLRYLKSSQSIHGNPLGLASFYERAHRPEPNRSWAAYAQAAETTRVLKDLTLYRLYSAYRFLQLDMKVLLSAYEDPEFDLLFSKIMREHHGLEYGAEATESDLRPRDVP